MSEERQPGKEPDRAEDFNPDENLPEEDLLDDEPPEEAGEPAEEVETTAETTRTTPNRPGRAERERTRRIEAERQLQIERENRARLEGQLQGRQPPAAPVDPAAEERAFLDSLQMLSSDQQALAIGRRVEQRTSQALMGMELRIADRLDKERFDRLTRDDPVAQRLAGRVEELIAAERMQGRNPDRETALNYLAGKELREKSGRAAAEQRRIGQRRIAAETTRPANSRSTAAAGNARRSDTNSEAAIEERWGDTPL